MSNIHFGMLPASDGDQPAADLDAIATGLEAAMADVHRLILNAADEAFRRMESTDGSLRELMEVTGVMDMRGASLAGADLRGENLSGIDFEDADLTNADLRDCDLSGANFRGARLEGARFKGARGTDPRLGRFVFPDDAPSPQPKSRRFPLLDFKPFRMVDSLLERLSYYLRSARPIPADDYPDARVDKIASDRYRLSLPVPGLGAADLHITARDNRLVIIGRRAGTFERRFELADYVRVGSVELKDEILSIELVREVPEGDRSIAFGSLVREEFPAFEEASAAEEIPERREGA